MADKKISQLTALSAANLAPSTDVLAIVDTSATETKKIVAQDLINGVLNVASAVGIGTASPAAKLDVNGSLRVGTATSVGATAQFGNTGNVITFIDSGATGVIGVSGANPLTFYTNGAERLRIDSAGNLGLGVTPSAWAIVKAFQIQRSSLSSYSDATPNASTQITTNGYYDGNWKYIASGIGAAQYNQSTVSGGSHQWSVAGTGTAGNTISGFSSAAMVLDSSGNLGVGTTTIGSRVTIGDPGTGLSFINATATTGFNIGLLAGTGSAQAYVFLRDNASLLFGTNNTERARISAGGNFGVNTTNPQQKIHITGNDQSNVRMRWENNGTGGRNYEIVGGLNAANNSSFSVYDATAAANRLEITSTGTFVVPQVYNDTTANAANMQVDSAGVFRRSTSSLRYKTDVQDATHGLAEVLALRPVTYKGKTDGDTIFGGLIAEEVHAAGLTEFVVYDNEGNPDALAYGNMVSVLVKAIQELKTELDAAKVKIAALEAK